MSFCDTLWIFALVGGLMGGLILGAAFTKWYITRLYIVTR
jgi:hypothetical protein